MKITWNDLKSNNMYTISATYIFSGLSSVFKISNELFTDEICNNSKHNLKWPQQLLQSKSRKTCPSKKNSSNNGTRWAIVFLLLLSSLICEKNKIKIGQLYHSRVTEFLMWQFCVEVLVFSENWSRDPLPWHIFGETYHGM